MTASRISPQVAASQLEIGDNYYNSVLDQARQSFRWALIAAGIGLSFFLVAVSSVLFRQAQDVSIISVTSGALIEVVSGINFYLYGKAATQLSNFHTFLDRIQRFLLANSACENIEGELKHTTRAELVRMILDLPQDNKVREGETK